MMVVAPRKVVGDSAEKHYQELQALKTSHHMHAEALQRLARCIVARLVHVPLRTFGGPALGKGGRMGKCAWQPGGKGWEVTGG